MNTTSSKPGSRTLLLAGSTGLVGRELLKQALAEGWAVHALVRRVPQPAPQSPQLHWQVVDFAQLSALSTTPRAEHALCALGTTIKVAGSQAAFRAVDFDAVLAFARAAKVAGVKHFGAVSALGASAGSSNFYSRVKGEAEAALAELGIVSLTLARPSLLTGDRAALGQPERPAEALALRLSKPLSVLIPAAWRPIDAATVARALQRAVLEGRPGVRVLSSGEMQRLGR